MQEGGEKKKGLKGGGGCSFLIFSNSNIQTEGLEDRLADDAAPVLPFELALGAVPPWPRGHQNLIFKERQNMDGPLNDVRAWMKWGTYSCSVVAVSSHSGCLELAFV